MEGSPPAPGGTDLNLFGLQLVSLLFPSESKAAHCVCNGLIDCSQSASGLHGLVGNMHTNTRS